MIQHLCVCGELYYDCNYWQHADCRPELPPVLEVVTIKELDIPEFIPKTPPKQRGRPKKERK